MTLADALAALIGVRYGSVRFATPDGTKSVEGSIAFFVVACLSTHVPLLLLSDVGRAESLLIGVIMGVLMMLVEAAAWQGLDNLFVPLVSYALLESLIPLTGAQLVQRLVVIAILAVIIFGWRKSTTLDWSGLIAAFLVAYATWIVGGWPWLLPPLVGYLVYAWLWPHAEAYVAYHNVHDMMVVNAGGCIWLLTASQQAGTDWGYMSALSYALQLAMTGYVGSTRRTVAGETAHSLTGIITIAWVAIFVPYALVQGGGTRVLLLGLAAMPIMVGMTLVFRQLWLYFAEDVCVRERMVVQAGVGVVGSVLGLLPWSWISV